MAPRFALPKLLRTAALPQTRYQRATFTSSFQATNPSYQPSSPYNNLYPRLTAEEQLMLDVEDAKRAEDLAWPLLVDVKDEVISWWRRAFLIGTVASIGFFYTERKLGWVNQSEESKGCQCQSQDLKKN